MNRRKSRIMTAKGISSQASDLEGAANDRPYRDRPAPPRVGPHLAALFRSLI